MNRVPLWRIVAAVLILGGLAWVLWVCTPPYFHNLTLQDYVAGLTRAEASKAQTDRQITDLILQKAVTLGLPVTADNVHILRQKDGKVQNIDVRYIMPVSLAGYTITLHFYPGAGSR